MRIEYLERRFQGTVKNGVACFVSQNPQPAQKPVEGSDVFESFTIVEKAHYRHEFSRFRDLIRDLEQDTAHEQLAS